MGVTIGAEEIFFLGFAERCLRVGSFSWVEIAAYIDRVVEWRVAKTAVGALEASTE